MAMLVSNVKFLLTGLILWLGALPASLLVRTISQATGMQPTYKVEHVVLQTSCFLAPLSSNHDLPPPIISWFLFRILEHPRAPNRLTTTRNPSQKPPAVHFHSRSRQVRLSIDIRYNLELSFNDIRMYMDHYPSQHPGTQRFSVGSP